MLSTGLLLSLPIFCCIMWCNAALSFVEGQSGNACFDAADFPNDNAAESMSLGSEIESAYMHRERIFYMIHRGSPACCGADAGNENHIISTFYTLFLDLFVMCTIIVQMQKSP